MSKANKLKSQLPRYAELANEFREQIENGQLKPGDRLPSFSEMRARYGIGQGTMERIHSLLKQDGLIEYQRGLGTFIARRRQRPRTGLIGLSGFGFTAAAFSPYWGHIVEGVHLQAKQEDAQVVLLDDSSPAGWEKIDGVLMASGAPERTLRWLPEELPCVSLFYAFEGVPSVVADDYEGTRSATAHLLSLGHRQIAYLGTKHERRQAGYRAALRNAKVKTQSAYVRRLPVPMQRVNFTDVGYSTMTHWLQEGWPELGCTAIVTHNDEAAIGVITALRENGWKVPEQVSVVGFDGIQAYEYFSPRLTTVEVPLQEIGARATAKLFRLITGEADDLRMESQVLPVHLKISESTAPAPR